MMEPVVSQEADAQTQPVVGTQTSVMRLSWFIVSDWSVDPASALNVSQTSMVLSSVPTNMRRPDLEKAQEYLGMDLRESVDGAPD